MVRSWLASYELSPVTLEEGGKLSGVSHMQVSQFVCLLGLLDGMFHYR
jgi:hypothetical protein